MFRLLAIVLALVMCFGFVTLADAQCVVGAGRGIGVQQRVIGNQLVTVDRFGNILQRQFIGGGRSLGVGRSVNVVNNRSLISIGQGRSRSLSDRLLFGF